jgi:hypothetical protein
MDKYPHGADHPVLPIMRYDDRDTLDLFVRFDEADVSVEGGNILPAAESGKA